MKGTRLRIFAVANQKGGVGKTTMTLCLAAALAQRGERVLVVDMDPQAGATKILGIDTSARPTLADLLLANEEHPIAEVVQPTDWGIDLAPSEITLAHKEQQRRPGDELLLRLALAAEPLDHAAVLIDCPPQLGALTINALAAATDLLLVTEPSFVAQTGLGDLLETHDIIRRRLNTQLQVGGVIINLVDHTRETRLRIAETEEFFGDHLVWQPHVPRRVVIKEALAKGVPVSEAGRDGQEVAAVFEELSKRIIA